MPETKNPLVAVTYIGRRESYVDRLYGSKLDFVQGQTRALPTDLAKKFLRHGDCFAFGDLPVTSKPATQDNTADVLDKADKAKHDEHQKLDEVQFLRDQIANMDKPALATIAKNSYGQVLDQRLSAPKLREQVTALVDRFGAV